MLRRVAHNGTSVILVTHHLPDIIPEISRVILLKDGKVWRDGPKEEMLGAGVLSDLFSTPVEVLERDGYYQLW
jgi:iron complex transport system ATP-binding protein